MKFETDKKGLLQMRDGWLWVEPKPLTFLTEDETVTFAIQLPIAEPLNMDWKQVDELFDNLFKQNDLCHNWIMAYLFQGEPIKTEHGQKYESVELPKDVYKRCVSLFPLLPTSTVASTISKKILPVFNKKKAKVFHGTEARPYFDPNQPLYLPVVSIDLKVLNMCGSPVNVAEFVIAKGKSNNRIQLRLQGGDHWGRENGILKDLMDGNAKLCACAVIKEYVNGVHHHATTEKDDNKTTRKVAYKVKIVVKRPISYSKKKTRTMIVSTHEDSFLSFWVGGKKFQTLNADNLKRWYEEEKKTFTKLLSPEIVKQLYPKVSPNTLEELQRIMSEDYAKHLSEKRREHLQRFSDDRKTEYRSGNTPHFNTKSSKIAEKFEKRTDSFIKQVCAMVVGHAKRQKCDEVVFDCSNGVMISKFPWFKVKSVLEHALKMNGIRFSGDICERQGDE
jgi:hypothetical protein